MAASPLMQLTRADGGKIVIVKAQIVSWSQSLDHDHARCVYFTNNRFQDVAETSDEISALFTKGL